MPPPPPPPPQVKDKKPHIKKPLNAFMLFMKEKRADVIKECTLKESAAINQILGKMVSCYWHVCNCICMCVCVGTASNQSRPL